MNTVKTKAEELLEIAREVNNKQNKLLDEAVKYIYSAIIKDCHDAANWGDFKIWINITDILIDSKFDEASIVNENLDAIRISIIEMLKKDGFNISHGIDDEFGFSVKWDFVSLRDK